MAKPELKRYRISVPADDEIVLEWIQHQHSLSMSVRQLVKDEIIRVGKIEDVFASTSDVLKSRQGQPLDSFDPPLYAETIEVGPPARRPALNVTNEELKTIKETQSAEKLARMRGLLDN